MVVDIIYQRWGEKERRIAKAVLGAHFIDSAIVVMIVNGDASVPTPKRTNT